MKLDYIPRTAATDGKSNTLYIDWADTEEYYNPDMEKYNLGRQEFWTPENKAKYLEIAKETGMKSVRTRAARLPVCISAIRLPLPIISLRCISRAMPTGMRSIRPANRSTTCSGYRCGVGNRGMNTGPASLPREDGSDRAGTFADDPFQSEESVGRPEEFAADRNRTACRACVGATSPIDAHDDHHRRTYKIDFDRLSAENGTIADLIL